MTDYNDEILNHYGIEKQAKTISENEFERKYVSIDSPSGSTIWEHREIRDQKKNHVWTVVEAEDSMYVMAGFHRVNMIGYVVTEKPWRDRNLQVEWD